MNNISSVGRNVPMLPAKTTQPAKQSNTAKTDTNDKVELSTGKKIGKAVLGTAISVVAAPVNAMVSGFQGSVNAADRALGIEGPQKGIGKNLQKIAVSTGALIGLVTGGAMGSVGSFAGALMGPGIVGGLIAGGQGVISGGKTGFKVTGKVANKVEKKVSQKLGSFMGKAAKIATAAALGMVAIPAMAIVGGTTKGIDFARTAIGIKKDPKTTGEAMGNLAKEGAVIYGAATGAIEAAPGFVAATAGALATAGGIGTGVTGVKEGVKGFVDGVKGSFNLADKIVRD